MGPLTGASDQTLTSTSSGGGWLGGAVGWIGETFGKVTDFVAGLPNEIIDFGESLGDRLFDPNSRTAQEARQFHERRLVGDIGPLILIGGAVLLFLALKK